MKARRSIPALARMVWAPALFVSAVLCPQARAQSAKLHVIDQGVADRGPLSTSQRVLPGDLRVPSGFDRVYQIGASRPSGSMFARISGGITAVFPKSQYVPTRDGYAAETPAGTVYYIGRLPKSLLEDPASSSRTEKQDYRPPAFDDRSARQATLDRPRTATPAARPSTPRPTDGPRRLDPVRPPAASAPPPEPTIFTDEAYRSHRVAELLDAASKAGQTH